MYSAENTNANRNLHRKLRGHRGGTSNQDEEMRSKESSRNMWSRAEFWEWIGLCYYDTVRLRGTNTGSRVRSKFIQIRFCAAKIFQHRFPHIWNGYYYTYLPWLLWELRMMTLEDFPGHSVVKTPPSNTGVQIQFLLGELRSHMPNSEAKNKQINTIIKRMMNTHSG